MKFFYNLFDKWCGRCFFRPKCVYHENKEGFITCYFLPSPEDTYWLDKYNLYLHWKIYEKKGWFVRYWIFEQWHTPRAWTEVSKVRFFIDRKVFKTQHEANEIAMLSLLEK